MESSIGNVNQQNNSNSSLGGNNNTGTIQNNSNMKLFGLSSVLNLLSNSNCKFNVENSELSSNSCSNSDVSGKSCKLLMKNNSNSSVSGDNNEIQMNSNSNFKLSGNNGRYKFEDNSNTNVHGNGNCVEAKGNSNLKIEGNENKIFISDTFNHVLNVVKEPNCNVFEVVPNPSGQLSSLRGISWFSNWSGGTSQNSSNIRFCVNYLTAANIRRNAYEMGIFKFNLEQGKEPDALTNLRLDDRELDQGSLNVSSTGTDCCIISGCKAGVKQQLQIVGPIVTHLSSTDPKLFAINSNNRSNF